MSTDVMTNPKTTTKEKKRISTKVIAQIGVLGAIAMVLMLFDIPLPFAPTFYKIDFSEVPVLIEHIIAQAYIKYKYKLRKDSVFLNPE